MVSEERKTLPASIFTLRNSLRFCRAGVEKCILSRVSFHFVFLVVWVFGFLLAICNTGCKHKETRSAARSPWLKDEPKSVVSQTVLWEAYVDEGRKAYSDGRYEEAEKLFKEAMQEAEKFGPENYRMGQSLYWLGAVVWDLGRPAEAKPLLERALGIIEQLKSTETAMLSRQIVMADILGRLSEIEAANENYSLAKALANKAAKISRDVGNKQLLAVSLKNLINVQVKNGDYNSALDALSELIQLDSSNPSYYYERALLYKRNGNYKLAVADLTKALELQPEHPRLLNELAWILSTCEADQIRNGRRSVELAQKAVEITKHKNPQCLDTLAAAYAETGQFDMAVKAQQQAISFLTDPEEIEIRLTRLRLYVDHKPYREINKK
jgi:tetratricopeptide (TPR) repeat protein